MVEVSRENTREPFDSKDYAGKLKNLYHNLTVPGEARISLVIMRWTGDAAGNFNLHSSHTCVLREEIEANCLIDASGNI